MTNPAPDLAAVPRAFAVYQTAVVPRVRHELRRWRAVAEEIPDPVLRQQALAAIDEKGLNVEAVAVFATLAPRPTRGLATEAIAILQIAIDYLDSLAERASPEPLEDGLQLHAALAVALAPGAEPQDWYRLHPRSDDGGYLSKLVSACQQCVAALPSQQTVPLARVAAIRCGEGQSHTHAALDDPQGLRRWATALGGQPEYRWWEVAAGASSSVAAHALLAAAADARTTAADAALVDAAYHPSVGALTVVLDDLIDRDEDLAAGEHSYLGYYESSAAAADRLAQIVARARGAMADLRHPRRHAAILAGVLAFYLSAPQAEAAEAAPIRDRLLETAGPSTRPLLAVMRARRRIRKRSRGTGSTSGP